MIHSTIISALLFSIATGSLLFSAENTQPKNIIARSDSSSWLGLWSSGTSVSPSSQSALLLLSNSTPSTSPSTAFGYVASCINGVANNLASAKDTLINASSDDAAARKLGWPINDAQAAQELTKTRNAYAQIKTTTNKESREKFFELVFRREAFLQRVYFALPNRADRIQLAQFCLEHHLPAMSPTLKLGFESFIERSAQEALQASGKNYPAPEVNQHTEIADTRSTLLKLGWPMSDTDKEEAHTILTQCSEIYVIKTIFEKSKNYELSQTEDGRSELLKDNNSFIAKKLITDPCIYDSFITTRTVMLRKINLAFLEKLSGSIGLLVAEHCLKNHMYIMSAYQAGIYRRFIRNQQAIAAKIYDEFAQTSTPYSDTK